MRGLAARRRARTNGEKAVGQDKRRGGTRCVRTNIEEGGICARTSGGG